jgi:serine/threonine protein kinase
VTPDPSRYTPPSSSHPAMPGQTCPRCSVSIISPRSGKCELCGYVLGTSVAVVATEDAVTAAAVRELAHEFDFGDLLGRGKGSAIYRVRERNGARGAILKVAARRPDVPDAEESFRAMLGMFAGFEHPHLVPVLRYGSTDSLFWYTTEDLGGTTLRTLLDDRGTLDARTCRRIATQVVGALDYLHRHGVVHGAIKVDNILLDKDGWVRVCDPSFLRARWKRRSRSTPSRGITAVGGHDPNPRPSWVAPEDHERGERLPAADQYSLGALLYECVTGQPPEHPPEPVLSLAAGLPPQMARAIDTAMSHEPFRRFGSLAEFLFALEARTSSSITPVVAPPPRRPSERVSRDVMMIPDWKPPAEPNRAVALIAKGTVAVTIVVALVWSAPMILRRQAPVSAPVVSTGIPSAVPSTPSEVTAPTAAPSAPPRTTPRTPPPAPGASTPSPASAAARTPAAPTPSPSTAAPAAAPATAAPGRLFVNASPWGTVFLDGVELGNTPRANVEVAAGQHTLRISRPGFQTVERVITVGAGETVRVTDIVLVPARP